MPTYMKGSGKGQMPKTQRVKASYGSAKMSEKATTGRTRKRKSNKATTKKMPY